MSGLFFNEYPYTDFHQLNLSWVINDLQELRQTIEQFVSINALKYADPIQWNITTQYEKNTIVIDPQTGTAYISVQPVPSGVSLANTDYWTVVFDLGAFVTRAAKNFTSNYEEDTTLTATMSLTAGDWVVWGDTLYRALVNITAGDQYVVGSNIEQITMEEIKNEILSTVNSLYTEISDRVGDLADLTTSDITSIVNAINSIITERGSLADLTTSDITSIVNAINSIITERGSLADLDTADKTSIVNAINDVVEDIYYLNVKDYGAMGDGLTDDTTAIQNTFNAAVDKTVILFPKGTYVINGTINVNKSYITIMGTDSAIITRSVQSNTDVFRVYDSNGSVYNFESKNITFNNITNGCVFKIIDVHNTYIHDCYIDTIYNFVTFGEHSTSNLMNIWSVIEHIIGNVTVDGSKFITIDGYTNGIHVYDCQINSENSLSSSSFLYCRPYSGIDTIDIERCLIQRFIYCIEFGNNNTTEPIQNVFIHNNIMDSNKYYCMIIENTNAGNGFITRFNITSNWFNSNEQMPIVVTSTAGHTTEINISNNFFVKMPSRAILVQGNTVSGITIQSNVFNGFNTEAPLSAIVACVTIGGIADGVIISNNQFAVTSDVTAYNQYAIYIASGCTGVVIVGNNLNNVTDPIYCESSAVIIENNFPDSINNIRTGLARYSSDAFSYWNGSSWAYVPSIMRHVGNDFYLADGNGSWTLINKDKFIAPYTVRWDGSSLQYLDSDGTTWINFVAP